MIFPMQSSSRMVIPSPSSRRGAFAVVPGGVALDIESHSPDFIQGDLVVAAIVQSQPASHQLELMEGF